MQQPFFTKTELCPDLMAAWYLNLASSYRDLGDPKRGLAILAVLADKHGKNPWAERILLNYEVLIETATCADLAGDSAMATSALSEAATARGLSVVFAKGKGFGGSEWLYACDKYIDRVWKGEDPFTVVGLRRHGVEMSPEDSAGVSYQVHIPIAVKAADRLIETGHQDSALMLLQKAAEDITERATSASVPERKLLAADLHGIREREDHVAAISKQKIAETEAAQEVVAQDRQAEKDAEEQRLRTIFAQYDAEDLGIQGSFKLQQNPYAYRGRTVVVYLSYIKHINKSSAVFQLFPSQIGVAVMNGQSSSPDQNTRRCIVKVLGTTHVQRDGVDVEVPLLQERKCLEH